MPRMGELVIFDPAKGRHEAERRVQRIPGYGRKVEPVIGDGLVDGTWPKFLHPYPSERQVFPRVVQAHARNRHWGIYLVDVFDNMVLLQGDAGLRAVRTHPATQDAPAPGDSRSRSIWPARTPRCTCSDIYAGGGLAGVPRGTVKKLRLFTYHFAYHGIGGILDYIGIDGPWDIRRVLGTVPVAEDGSANSCAGQHTDRRAAAGRRRQGPAIHAKLVTAMPGETVSVRRLPRARRTARRTSATVAWPWIGEPVGDPPWHGPVRGFSLATARSSR